MRIEPEIGGVAIVLVGNFNPAIFSPLWFAKRGIVSDAEAEEAEIQVIHPEVAMFRVGSTNVHVEQERFLVESSEAPWISLCDFVSKTFGDYLPHTPVTAFGINRHVHFKFSSADAKHALGRQLAPLAPWGDWGREIDAKAGEQRSGVVNLDMRELWNDSDWQGYTQATIQPSAVLSGNAGVYIRVSDHNSPKSKADNGSESAMAYLTKKFEGNIRRAEWIIDQVMAAGSETK